MYILKNCQKPLYFAHTKATEPQTKYQLTQVKHQNQIYSINFNNFYYWFSC